MTTPSAEEREAWRALAEGATPGPWEVDEDHSVQPRDGAWDLYNTERLAIDAAFIATAREGWPRTLDALEAAERAADEAYGDGYAEGRDEAETRDLSFDELTDRVTRAELDAATAREYADATVRWLNEERTKVDALTIERDVLAAEVAGLKAKLGGAP